MKTNWLRVLASAVVLWSGSVLAQPQPAGGGGGGIDAAALQQMAAEFQQRISQMDPAQLQQLAGRLNPAFSQMDPAEFQQMVGQFQTRIQQFQDRVGQMDPAQLQQMVEGFQQRMGGFGFGATGFSPRRLARLREQMEITDDAEWKVVEGLIQKVVEAQQSIQTEVPRGIMSLNLGTNSVADILSRFQTPQTGQNGGQSRAGFLRTSPEGDALRKAVQERAAPAEVKAALDKLAVARKEHRAALEKAQAELRKVLTVKQEAVATVNGLL